jgi:hypothetical protein
MMDQRHEMRGHFTLKVSDKKGEVICERACNNHIVTSGRELVARLFGGFTSPQPTRVTHMAVGTDPTAAADNNTRLGAQRDAKPDLPRKQISGVTYEPVDEPQPGTNATVRRIRARLTAEFDYDEANGGVALREAGTFTAETGGVMYNRVTFDPVTKTDAFKLTLIWDIVF